MKIKFNSILFISLLVFSTCNTVASEPEGTGVFVLSVDNNPGLKELAQKIVRAIEGELRGLKERLGRGLRKELERYAKFEREITEELARFDVGRLKEIARKNFPAIYPVHIKDPNVSDKHPALWQIYKLAPFAKPKSREKEELTEKQAKRAEAAGLKAQAKIDKSKKALMNNLERTQRQFNAFKNSLDAMSVIPTKILHTTLCRCTAGGCNRPRLKQFFSKFYDAKTHYVEFSIEEIAVYDDGPGWIVLKITSSYLDRLIQRLQNNGTFKCNVRTPFRAHISILKFGGLEGGQRNTILQLLRTFLITAGPDLLREFKQLYCIDIKEFGIKKRGVEFLYGLR